MLKNGHTLLDMLFYFLIDMCLTISTFLLCYPSNFVQINELC